MRILISSCFPIDHGGYPNQINYLLDKLYKNGDKMGVISWNFTYPYQPTPLCLDDILAIEEFKDISKDLNMDMYKEVSIYSTHTKGGNYENFWKKLEIFVSDFKPDILFFYQDILIFPNYDIGKLPCKKYLWLPIHDNFKENPLIPMYIADPEKKYVDSTLRFLPIFDKIACFSKFGQDVLGSYGYDATLIYHSISSKLWKPLRSLEIRNKYRKTLGISEDCFVCIMVASNTELSNRKAFDYNMRGFAIFSKTFQNTKLIIKSNMEGVANLWDIAKSLGISNKIINLPNKIPQREIAILYGVSDVLLSASKSEGFGIPIIEAQLCGLPVITTECTAMPENTYLGICTKPKEVSLRIADHNSWSHPDVDEIANAIGKIQRGEYSKTNVPTEKYDPDLLWEQWKKFIY